MDSFMIAINVIAPLCILVGLGYYAKESNMVSKNAFEQMNQIVFKILIPTVLMKSIMETDLSVAFQPKLLAFAIISIFLMCAVLCIIVPKFEKDRKRSGVIIQAIYRSNFVLFGLAIAGNMYGSDNVAVTSVLIAFCVPLFNVLSVLILQFYGMESVDVKSLVKGLFTNPMLVGTIIGFVILLFHIPIPTFLNNAISDIGKMATPLALLVLGGTFEIQSVAKNKKALTAVVCGRLILIPLIFVSIAVLLGYRQVELISLLVLFASPVAVSSFAMALAMDCDGELASQSVLITTIGSVFSMIVWISVLTALGFL